jgi:sugar phosphate isomerase/epimerase
MTPYPLGIVAIVFGNIPATDAAGRAAALGFDHIDVTTEEDEARLALPVVDRFRPSPTPGCSTGAPPERDGMWERAVRAFRRAPGSRVEPWPGSILSSVEKVKTFLAEVPGLRLLLDTGHVANWGEDPVELIPFAAHIQLRQASRDRPQALEGDIDFARFIDACRDQGYAGVFSVEYFDLPDLGWPLDDPLRHALALAEHVRPLL